MRWIKETILPRAATARASLITTALLALPRNVSPSPRLLLSIGLALLLGSTGEAQEARFEACTDGLTVADNATGLLWEKKAGTVGSVVNCDTIPGSCPDPHDVNNRYAWSNTGTLPDGNAYTDFLAALNTDGFAGHTDWRLPAIEEHQRIMIGPSAIAGQSPTCTEAQQPCLDPEFASIAGPTFTSIYWSSSSYAPDPNNAWTAQLIIGAVFNGGRLKTENHFVRAVRAGSCPIAGT
ncbi:MAG: DUF1566 domain-containing protein, partial [bacterium]